MVLALCRASYSLLFSYQVGRKRVWRREIEGWESVERSGRIVAYLASLGLP